MSMSPPAGEERSPPEVAPPASLPLPHDDIAVARAAAIAEPPAILRKRLRDAASRPSVSTAPAGRRPVSSCI
jgi:hypothetical protein